jgi:hypothetical protein
MLWLTAYGLCPNKCWAVISVNRIIVDEEVGTDPDHG